MTNPGYEAEPTDVAAIVDAELADFTDPLERYARASAAEALYRSVANAFADERASAVLALHEAGMSYQRIADATLIGTRGRAQQLVERARESVNR